jgi:CRISPR system Cascade subunit CasC
MLIQIHLLQNYAPANLNRDDTGAPKDTYFGGTRRGRISSQCLKRSIRRSEPFREAFDADGLLGVRTRQLPHLIQVELEALGVEADAIAAIVARVPQIGRESTKGEQKEVVDENAPEVETGIETALKQLVFIGKDELRPLAEKLLGLYREVGAKKWASLKGAELTKNLGASLPTSVDISMFGRMTTSAAFEDVSAAVQVAHALSTNVLSQEFDYYTAVDDLSTEPGAGMIGDVEFNSSTYYKYLNVHWEELMANLKGDAAVARKAVRVLVEAAATAQPSGKQNTFAAFNLPDLVLVEVSRRNLPVSYANAFVRPARATPMESILDASQKQLAEYMGCVQKTYALAAERAYISLQEVALPGAQALVSLPALQDWLTERLAEA